MAFDFKQKFPELYSPKATPGVVTVPPMNFAAVRGHGAPMDPSGRFQLAIELLYHVVFVIKMSGQGPRQIDWFFDFVVPPLEGFWWQDGVAELDLTRKDALKWILAIRLPDFVTEADFDWAVQEAARKKDRDFSAVALFRYEEGLCVQCMHTGAFDDAPATVAAMRAFALEQGYRLDYSPTRLHHEIYLSDARSAGPDRLRTVLRLPIRHN